MAPTSLPVRNSDARQACPAEHALGGAGLRAAWDDDSRANMLGLTPS